MSDTEMANGQTATAAAPSLNVLTQYIKDLSFESPNAPGVLRGQSKPPAINIGVNVSALPVNGSDGEYDVKLTLNARAGEGAEAMFLVELQYGGIFRVQNFPQEHLLPVLFIECPRLLFPFARQVIADVTRNGGFPPLMVDPIDFAALFQQRMAEERARQQVQPS
ncbi:protein-export chaperone SecB [Aureimonas altamirensis]|jgi:preprotein translocase subunit SecB|uniref:Protein-export protein SecB n=2 Tax=Aureimonas altamirensis TaxID=370622 RepID=A0A0P0YVY4_9HYPH|nr:protein-export chaperone SecB [Aureimonas altamirensis]BAT25371.1 protein-export chaperone SecB [Aureimonas altamirensis]SHJ98919.1 protein translocase subunit secB [Aureimonas altamirensis DSM 21988]